MCIHEHHSFPFRRSRISIVQPIHIYIHIYIVLGIVDNKILASPILHQTEAAVAHASSWKPKGIKFCEDHGIYNNSESRKQSTSHHLYNFLVNWIYRYSMCWQQFQYCLFCFHATLWIVSSRQKPNKVNFNMKFALALYVHACFVNCDSEPSLRRLDFPGNQTNFYPLIIKLHYLEFNCVINSFTCIFFFKFLLVFLEIIKSIISEKKLKYINRLTNKGAFWKWTYLNYF